MFGRFNVLFKMSLLSVVMEKKENKKNRLVARHMDQFSWIAFLKYYPKGLNLGL
jgi:hypothetical protein